jgi:hypothetical protein
METITLRIPENAGRGKEQRESAGNKDSHGEGEREK